MSQYRDMIRMKSLDMTNMSISVSLGCGRNTVSRALARAEEEGITWEIACNMTEAEVAGRLYGEERTDKPQNGKESPYLMPDYEWVHREMRKPHVTLRLLWAEYARQAAEAGKLAYGQTQFNKYYAEFRNVRNVTMHLEHTPGSVMEVDWAGSPVYYTDPDTGELIRCSLFVAVLPCSGYSYAEAMPSMKQEFWFRGHVNAYMYFGGVTRTVTPDNLKASVIRNGQDGVILNRTYQELAEHYGTAVVPARPRKPRDKASVEGLVRNVGTHVIATLRNIQFFSLFELNDAILEGLYAFNHKPFQKREGSRASVFEAEEKATLLPLPETPFDIAEWRKGIVQLNYHISVDRMNYSVPYQYSKKEVDIRLSFRMVKVFHDGEQIAEHTRLRGRPGQYSTKVEHMPEQHREYTAWSSDRLLNWAGSTGPNTRAVIDFMLKDRPVEQQAYRGCISVLKLPKTMGGSGNLLETACTALLQSGARPSFRTVKAFYSRTLTQADAAGQVPQEEPSEEPSEFIRGSGYYGGEG